jgi:flagellar P-ring protein precursor FlgI
MRSVLHYIALLCIFIPPLPAHATSRIKDIVSVEGVRENQLVGYGLVVGLNGTGDNLNNAPFTQKGLIDFLERLGVNTRGSNLKTKNIAAVTVTAALPAFARSGSNIDVTVSTLGDAKSLQGGTLLATPLLGADGEVYAVGQGSVTIGGFQAVGKGTTVNKGVSTNGFIANGAIVEKEIDFDLNAMNSIKLALRNPDMSTSVQIAETINNKMHSDMARATDPGTVSITVPAGQKNNVVGLLSTIEKIDVETDQTAKVVIDEASGTIVIGENVRIDTVAIAQGNLTITIKEDPQVSQPGPLSGGSTVAVPNTTIKVDEQKGNRMVTMERGTTLKELVAGLNALGVGPRDMITILQTIKSAGALQAELQIK